MKTWVETQKESPIDVWWQAAGSILGREKSRYKCPGAQRVGRTRQGALWLEGSEGGRAGRR